MGPRTDRRHQQGEESRQRILDATIAIAAERGYEGTSISLVSRRSGLPASSIYWHFASKDELLAAVIDRSYHRWLDSIPKWSPPAADRSIAEHLRATWMQITRALADNAEFLRLGLMLSLEHRPDEPKARSRFLRSRQESHDRMVDWYAKSFDHAGVEPDLPLCRDLATLNMAVADGLFVDGQVQGSMRQSARLMGLFSSMLADRIDAAVEAAGPHPLTGAPAPGRTP